jgi:DNA polymerase I-like protein with 3'-5' exonuclease and polymerase domains
MDDLFTLFDDRKEIDYPEWTQSGEFEFILVNQDNLAECIDACLNATNKRFALDLECTGTDNRVDESTGITKDKIVGVCLSGDGKRGWYIPLRHKEGAEHNVPWSVFDKEFRRLMDAVDAGEVVAVFHNAKFDQEFLEFWGGEPYGKWDGVKRWEDTLILAYLRNSRARRKGLKALSEAPPDADNTHFTGGPGLGMRMLELEDLFPDDHPRHLLDFSLLNPGEDGPRIYGCSDAICTWLLCDLLYPAVITPKHGFSQRQIYNIEKGAIIAARWMERNRIPTSPEKVMELIKLGQQEWFDSIMVVYEEASKILGRDVMPGYYKVLKYNKPGADQGGFVPDDPLNLLPEQVTRAKAFAPRYFPDPMGKATTRDQEWPLIYDVNAPQQLGMMFDEMAVPGLIRTEKSNQVKTSKDVLEMVIERTEDRFPFMSKIKRFRETNKALSSYLFPMLEDVDPDDFTMRINFNGLKVDTGRFSTPAKEKELTSTKKRKRIPGWPEINLQSMPATYDPRRPASMTRLRECIVARPGYFIVAIDFAGEELRLVTNLSREPLWLEEFFRCSGCGRKFPRGDGSNTPAPPPPRCPNCGSDKIGDLHTLTALSIYGEDSIRWPEWKQLRGNAKGVNFALCYGGGGGAVVRACSVDKNEGWRIKNQFDGTYTGLKRWWTGQHKFANKHGFVLTGFGRVYPVPDIWSQDGGFRSKAERNSVNGPIQGSGADIIKIAMALIYRHCKKKDWLQKCRMIACMHDELVFEMHESIIEEAIADIVPIMTSNKFVLAKRWPVPLTTDTEIGRDWTVKWDLNEMRHGEVKFDGDKKVKEPKKPQLKDFDSPAEFKDAEAKYQEDLAAWEANPHTFPATLRAVFKNLGGPGGAASTPPFDDQPTPVPAVASAAPSDAPEEPSSEAEPERATAPDPALVADRATVVPKGDLPEFQPPKGNEAGGYYDFTLRAPLTNLTCVTLARIIQECKNRGTRKLRILLPDGTVLDNWSSDGDDVFVNDQEFYWMAQRQGL